MKMKAASLVLILGFTLTACMKTSKNQEIKDPGTTQKPNPEKPKPKPFAILFGDSLAAGFGVKSENSTLASCLTKLTKGKSVVKAQAGSTTHEILAQIKANPNDDATLIFLTAGAADVMEDLYGAGFTEEESVKNFEAITAELKTRKAKVVYLSLNPPLSKATRLARLGRMAETAGFKVVDGMKGLWGDKEFMADKIHPNDKGFQKICERLTAALK